MRTPSLLPLLLLIAGCDGCDGLGDQTVYLADANNFSYVGTIDARSNLVASGVNITICFNLMLEDIQCHEVDPITEVGIVTMARFNNLMEEEVEEQISNDTLPQSAVSGYLSFLVEDGETCVELEDFTLQGTPVDLANEFYEGGGTYLILVGAGTDPGQGTLAMEFLAPVEGNDTTEVYIDTGCGTLDFTADLSSLEPAALPSAGESWPVDWGDLSVTGLGNPLSLSDIDRVMIGHYADLSVADLEESFLDLEYVASDLWYLDLSGGFSADLADATGDSGSFPGFGEDGTYVLALMCTTCSNPAPLFLTVVQPEAE